VKRRDVSPEELEAALRIIKEYPDLDDLEHDLAIARALGGPQPLAFRNAGEVLQAVRLDVLSPSEARPFLGLPERLPWWRRLFSANGAGKRS
jgi:hypothetical protein